MWVFNFFRIYVPIMGYLLITKPVLKWKGQLLSQPDAFVTPRIVTHCGSSVHGVPGNNTGVWVYPFPVGIPPLKFQEDLELFEAYSLGPQDKNPRDLHGPKWVPILSQLAGLILW